MAAIAGLGSFGLHHMVITDVGCAGRFGSPVTGAELPIATTGLRERCLYYYDGSCRACIAGCPVGALGSRAGFDRQSCWERCLKSGTMLGYLGPAEVCGKCAVGRCAFESPVWAFPRAEKGTYKVAWRQAVKPVPGSCLFPSHMWV